MLVSDDDCGDGVMTLSARGITLIGAGAIGVVPGVFLRRDGAPRTAKCQRDAR